jgi:hypothetical protein
MRVSSAENLREVLQQIFIGPEFRGVLAQVWAEHGAGEPDYPTEVYRTVKWAPQNFPCGELYVLRGRNNAPESVYVDRTYEVTVFWHVQGTDEEAIESEVGRLTMATMDYFRERSDLMPYLNGAVTVGDDDYSPFIPVNQGGDNALIKTGAVTLFIRVMR